MKTVIRTLCMAVVAVVGSSCASAGLQHWRTADRSGVVSVPLCESCRAPSGYQQATAADVMKQRCSGQAPVVDEEGVALTGDERFTTTRYVSPADPKEESSARLAINERARIQEREWRWTFHCGS